MPLMGFLASLMISGVVKSFFDLSPLLRSLLRGRRIRPGHGGDRLGRVSGRRLHQGRKSGLSGACGANRTQAFDYQISRFTHRFAAILCLQNSTKEAGTGEPYLYNCPYRPELQEHLSRDKFPAYVAEQGIERAQVQLEPGDLYFFFTENVHEVPAIIGDQPRAVLAIFFAMSSDDDEIYVWA